MDKLKLYRGYDDQLGHLQIHSPTLGEICDYGEDLFFNLAYQFCAIPTDYMLELEEQGIRYEDLDEYSFFINILFEFIDAYDVSILFPNLDMSSMELGIDKSGNVIRYNFLTGEQFDENDYKQVTAYLREMFGFKYQPRFAATELTRTKMLEVERLKRIQNAKKESSSYLLPLVSAMVNCADFKYSHKDVWDMPFFAFMDSVKRVQAVRTANQMFTGGYFGLKLSDVKEHLNWVRPL